MADDGGGEAGGKKWQFLHDVICEQPLIFDPLLESSAHIQYLKKKLRASFAIIKRIPVSSYIRVPTANYKSIYHTLFESHLSYCLSTWGGARKKLVDQVFITQKIAIRYLLGNYEKFLDKFNISARTRPYGEQQLGVSFYRKKHTKPLLNKHNPNCAQSLCIRGVQ